MRPGMLMRTRLDIVAQLKTDILRLQQFCSLQNAALDVNLGPLGDAFPNGSFPIGAVHEFLSSGLEDTAVTTGFISAILSSVLGNRGVAVWISTSRKLFPPALKNLNVEPGHFIFLDLQKERDVLWATNEALKCEALKAVVAEVGEMSFTESRRLQLAVEQSHVTGFIINHTRRKPGTTACVSRWKIISLPSQAPDGLPGIGFPKWRVELLRIRNGKPGSWDVEWRNGKWIHVEHTPSVFEEERKKVG